MDDDKLTDYLWPIVREMVKTAIENGQNLIVEGCYIPFDWKKDFSPEYLSHIRYCCLIMSRNYIEAHFEDISCYGNAIEQRLDDSGLSKDMLIQENERNLHLCQENSCEYILLDDRYDLDLERFPFALGEDGAVEVRYVKDRVQLLRAGENDAQVIRAMQQEAFGALLENYQDHETSPANESIERITWKLRQPDSYFYRIVVGGETVGAIRVVDAGGGSRKRISPLFILPVFRGKGYAQSAILEAEKRHGAHNWELATILQETGNCYLYEKMGYRQTGNRTAINGKMTIVGYEKD